VKRFSQQGMYNPMADINIVPLMDLVFNLLIVFMLTTPLLEQSIDIKLPTAQSGTQISSKNVTTINVDPLGRAFIDEKKVSLSDIEQIVRRKITDDPQHAVLVRGDEKVPYGKFVEIVDHLKHAGVTKLGIVGITSH
jgi:biopolymer transport protein TolR